MRPCAQLLCRPPISLQESEVFRLSRSGIRHPRWNGSWPVMRCNRSSARWRDGKLQIAGSGTGANGNDVEAAEAFARDGRADAGGDGSHSWYQRPQHAPLRSGPTAGTLSRRDRCPLPGGPLGAETWAYGRLERIGASSLRASPVSTSRELVVRFRMLTSYQQPDRYH